MIPVTELFGPTIQGEGIMTGTFTHFLRTGGCPLRCFWCDSMDSVLPELVKANAERLQPSEILQRIAGMTKAPWITFTGGDPCMHRELGELIPVLNGPQYNMRVAVETQGTLFPEWLKDVDVVTFSPKPPSSGNEVDVQPIVDWINAHANPSLRICVKVVVDPAYEGDLQYAMNVYNAIKPQLIEGFYFTACSPVMPPANLSGADPSVYPLVPSIRALSLLGLYTELAHILLDYAADNNIQFHNKTHVGCQQHVLLWPAESKGV